MGEWVFNIHIGLRIRLLIVIINSEDIDYIIELLLYDSLLRIIIIYYILNFKTMMIRF